MPRGARAAPDPRCRSPASLSVGEVGLMIAPVADFDQMFLP
jgi:hypothetical protein